MISIISFFLAMSILVFVHEFGHYYIAKLCGVRVEQFSIGFGKEIFHFVDKDSVRWKFCLVPIGGYVKLHGSINPDEIKQPGTGIFDAGEALDKSKAFFAKPLYQRFLIVAAGPIANYLLAITILSIFYFCFGKMERPAIIDEIVPNSPAAYAGLQIGDQITKIDDNVVLNFGDMHAAILLSNGKAVKLTLERDNQLHQVTLTPTENLKQVKEHAKAKSYYIGIISKKEPLYIKLGAVSAIGQGIFDSINISAITLKALGQMIVGQRSTDEISGILTIAQESGRSLSTGIENFALFIAFMSINLGLMNLLPVPMLDGGYLALMIYEAIAQKTLNYKMQHFLFKIGSAIIIFLIVISVSNDIRNLIF